MGIITPPLCRWQEKSQRHQCQPGQPVDTTSRWFLILFRLVALVTGLSFVSAMLFPLCFGNSTEVQQEVIANTWKLEAVASPTPSISPMTATGVPITLNRRRGSRVKIISELLSVSRLTSPKKKPLPLTPRIRRWLLFTIQAVFPNVPLHPGGQKMAHRQTSRHEMAYFGGTNGNLRP